MSQPIIGITPSGTTDKLSHGTFYRHVISDAYVRAVEAAGGLPIILPIRPGSAASVIEVIDGLILSGGGDVDPQHYGDPEVHPKTYGIDPARDAFELELAIAARERDVPLFCICRGVQVLNVAYGGTLHQHLEPDRSGRTHRQHEVGLADDAIGHQVEVLPGQPLATLYGDGQIGVNSFHHQAIKEVAPGLVPAAIDEAGTVEAVVDPTQGFTIGVQWHPELMFERHPEQLAPFRALVEAARARRLVSTS